jgi:CRP-like cAMP-binding protein
MDAAALAHAGDLILGSPAIDRNRQPTPPSKSRPVAPPKAKPKAEPTPAAAPPAGKKLADLKLDVVRSCDKLTTILITEALAAQSIEKLQGLVSSAVDLIKEQRTALGEALVEETLDERDVSRGNCSAGVDHQRSSTSDSDDDSETAAEQTGSDATLAQRADWRARMSSHHGSPPAPEAPTPTGSSGAGEDSAASRRRTVVQPLGKTLGGKALSIPRECDCEAGEMKDEDEVGSEFNVKAADDAPLKEPPPEPAPALEPKPEAAPGQKSAPDKKKNRISQTTKGTAHSLSGSEMMALDQHDGLSFVRSDSFPYIFMMPEGTFAIIWGIVVLVIVLIQAVTIPLDAAFDRELLGWVEWIVLGFFVLDIMFSFIRPIEDGDGNMILEYRKIAQSYVLGPWFFMDVISCIPFESFAGRESSNVAAVKTLKLFRLTRVSKLVKRIAKNAKSAGASIQVMMLLLTIVYVFHWVACGWVMVGNAWCMHDKPRRGCTGNKALAELYQEEWRQVYVLNLWQASCNFFGGGSAESEAERLYFSFVCVIGAVFQAIIFGSFTNVIKSLNEEYAEHQRVTNQTLSWMQTMHLPEHLQDRVLLYYEKLWHHQHTTSLTSDTFISNLSPPLRLDLMMSLFKDMMLKLPFLRDLTPPVIEELVMRLHLRVYMKGDFLMYRGEMGSWMGFISRGVCAVLNPDNSKEVIAVLRIGANIGEAGLFGKPRTADVLALTWVNLQILRLEDWSAIAELYPDEMANVARRLQDIEAKYATENERKAKEKERRRLSLVDIAKPTTFMLEETPREGGAVELLKEAKSADGNLMKGRGSFRAQLRKDSLTNLNLRKQLIEGVKSNLNNAVDAVQSGVQTGASTLGLSGPDRRSSELGLDSRKGSNELSGSGPPPHKPSKVRRGSKNNLAIDLTKIHIVNAAGEENA